MLKNPSSRLPGEIFAEVLSWAVGRIELHIHQCLYAASESHSPWDLALVCKDWRDVVLSTPCIWSNISLKVIPNRQTIHKYDALLSALKLCLDRSCTHPLTIELIINDGGPSNLIPIFINPLMEHIQQWETVTFRASLDTLLPYLSNYPVQYTRLRRLCIDNDLYEPEENWVGLFQDAPLLSHISLNSLPNYCQRLGGAGIPWSQISHLRIYTYSGRLDDLIDILKNTSNLITLDYSILCSYSSPEGPPILELSHLQQLVWAPYYEPSHHADRPFTSQFFRLLKAPKLSALDVHGVCGDEEVEAIRSCLRRSNCSITSLNLSTPRLSSLLSLTPDVETLVFTKTPIVIHDDDVKCNDFVDGPLHGFELARLQKIQVLLEDYDADGLATPQFFESLKAPRLSVLELDGVCSDRELKAIRGCLQRSKCSITSLKLLTYRLPSLLSLTLDVETVVLPFIDDEYLIPLLKKLTLDHSAVSCLSPRLKKIVLNFDIPDGPLFDAFIGMLKSRLRAPPNPVVGLRCNTLKELELGIFFSDIKHRIPKRLTSQEDLVITYARLVQLYDPWDF